MSFVAVVPHVVGAAAADLARIGSTLSAASSAAAAGTTGLLAAGTDEVSVAVAALFSQHALSYQQVSDHLSAVNRQFVQALHAGAGAYADAEAANLSLLDLVNTPSQALFGRPLIGDGAAGTSSNPNGQAGGLLWGSGGAGYSSTAAGVAGGNGGSAGLIGHAVARLWYGLGHAPLDCQPRQAGEQARHTVPHLLHGLVIPGTGAALGVDRHAPVRGDADQDVPDPHADARRPGALRQAQGRLRVGSP